MWLNVEKSQCNKHQTLCALVINMPYCICLIVMCDFGNQVMTYNTT